MTKFITKNDNGYTLGLVDVTENGKVEGYRDYVRIPQTLKEIKAEYKDNYLYSWDRELHYVNDIIDMGGKQLDICFICHNYCIMTASDEIINSYWAKLEAAFDRAVEEEKQKEASENAETEKHISRINAMLQKKGLTIEEAHKNMIAARKEYNEINNEGGDGYVPDIYYDMEKFLLAI